MSEILPEGEDLRRAIKWLSVSIQESPGRPIQPLVDEAIFKFDLSPKDAEFLLGFYRKHKDKK